MGLANQELPWDLPREELAAERIEHDLEELPWGGWICSVCAKEFEAPDDWGPWDPVPDFGICGPVMLEPSGPLAQGPFAAELAGLEPTAHSWMAGELDPASGGMVEIFTDPRTVAELDACPVHGCRLVTDPPSISVDMGGKRTYDPGGRSPFCAKCMAEDRPASTWDEKRRRDAWEKCSECGGSGYSRSVSVDCVRCKGRGGYPKTEEAQAEAAEPAREPVVVDASSSALTMDLLLLALHEIKSAGGHVSNIRARGPLLLDLDRILGDKLEERPEGLKTAIALLDDDLSYEEVVLVDVMNLELVGRIINLVASSDQAGEPDDASEPESSGEHWAITCAGCPSNRISTLRPGPDDTCSICGSAQLVKLCGSDQPASFDWARWLLLNAKERLLVDPSLCRICGSAISNGERVYQANGNKRSVAHRRCVSAELGYAAVMLLQGQVGTLDDSMAEEMKAGLTCAVCAAEVVLGDQVYHHAGRLAHLACVDGRKAEPPLREDDDRDYCTWNPAEERDAKPGDPWHSYARVLVGNEQRRLCLRCRRLKPWSRKRKEVPLKSERNSEKGGDQTSSPSG